MPNSTRVLVPVSISLFFQSRYHRCRAYAGWTPYLRALAPVRATPTLWPGLQRQLSMDPAGLDWYLIGLFRPCRQAQDPPFTPLIHATVFVPAFIHRIADTLSNMSRFLHVHCNVRACATPLRLIAWNTLHGDGETPTPSISPCWAVYVPISW